MTTRTASPWDAIAQTLEGFEARKEQLAMAAAVAGAIEDRTHLVVEAGTGVGKSFAYLVPALEAIRADPTRRVVVSTRTIALQEQLVERDLPFLLAALDLEHIPVAIAKGRNNYVCRRRTERAHREGPGLFDEDLRDEIARIREWAAESEDGTLSDLGFKPDGRVWGKCCAERGNCMGKKCAFYADCAYQASRKRISGANLIVANHTLVMIDAAMRLAGARCLPERDLLVLDEAHEVEEVATEAFTTRLTEAGVKRVLGRLFSRRGATGILTKVGARGAVVSLVDDCRDAAEAFFGAVDRFKPPFVPHRVIDGAGAFEDPLSLPLSRLIDELKRVHAPDPELGLELASARRSVRELAGSVERFAEADGAGFVYWAEKNERTGKPALNAAPLEVAPFLRETVFAKNTAVVCTSATLRVGKGFGHLRAALGIDEATELDVGSPFDFARQCELRTYPGLPQPSSPKYPAATHDAMRDLVLAVKGGAFLLFTSYRALEEAHAALAGGFEAAGLTILRHGDKAPREIVETFREHDNCVLFGTATFWQGVDVKGPNLRLVVLHKLPFAVPSHPLRQARDELCRGRGKVPFTEISVPEAVIRVKQGFGRLIRSATDTGTVAILDPRMHTKSYGRTFLASLPSCRHKEVAP